MNKEKWEEIKGRIKDEFEVLEEKTLPLAEEGEDRPGEKEYIIFNGPMGKIKVEFVVRPVVLEKRGVGSRRIGSQVAIEYKYSEDEFVYTLKAYKWNDEENDWQEIEVEKSFGI